MYASTLIILSAGESSSRIDELLQAHPRARVWTINAVRHERAELQFEIHSPVPRNELHPSLPTIVSTTCSSPGPITDRGPLWKRFPLDAAAALGEPFLELTTDYALAYAALMHMRRLPDGALPPGVSGRAFERIFLCGVDLNDPHHFARSRGAHFWLGLLRGIGIEVTPMPESTLLAGGATPDVPVPPRFRRPYCYGQVLSV